MKRISSFCFVILFTQTFAFNTGGLAFAATAAKTYLSSYNRPKDVPFPKDNAHSNAREDLGRTLFFDPRLSGSD